MTIEQLKEYVAEFRPGPLSTPCWIHRNKPNSVTGYVQMSVDGRQEYIQRIAISASGRLIPKGMEAHHVCEVKQCCNPEHIEPQTPRAHRRLGEPAKRTHCPQGHEYTPENTITRGRWRGKYFKVTRECRTCVNEKFKVINAARRQTPEYKEQMRLAQQRHRARKKSALQPSKGSTTLEECPPNLPA